MAHTAVVHTSAEAVGESPIASPTAPNRTMAQFPSSPGLERTNTGGNGSSEGNEPVNSSQTIFAVEGTMPGCGSWKIKSRSLILAIVFILVAGAVVLLGIWLSRH